MPDFHNPHLSASGREYLPGLANSRVSLWISGPAQCRATSPQASFQDLSLETDAPEEESSTQILGDPEGPPLSITDSPLLLGCFMSGYISSQSQAWNAELSSDIASLHPRA